MQASKSVFLIVLTQLTLQVLFHIYLFPLTKVLIEKVSFLRGQYKQSQENVQMCLY